jgi:hypothetical protein
MKRIGLKLALAVLLGLVPVDALGQCCGDCNADGAVQINELVTAVNRALTSCSDDHICRQRFPASGQTTSYGPGSDGDVKAGAALSYIDNGDGTITDLNTGLMWEKKDAAGGIHDQGNRYTWGMASQPYAMNGTMVTEFLATLNRAPCFAGHCDWRIPNVKELQSIVDYEIPYPGPAVDATFNTNCFAGCTVNGDGGPMCSCTASDGYWSSTTFRLDPVIAWGVNFMNGYVSGHGKSLTLAVRAVRGGL